MENMYNPACSSSLSPPPPEPPDDISLFLHQILLRSSASPYSLMAHNGTPKQSISPLLSGSELRISAVEASSGAVFSSSDGYFAPTAPNLCSSSVGTIDNDPDEYDCESEEGFEALVGEVPEKPVPLRNNSSKRGRAAEVHNTSEKRRRCRINEKMKALQNLIPNSNKTDKASMLDEAIEYLKQLQLQVQMLTMRHGSSLYPMCLPGVLQQAQFSQMKMDFCEGNGLLNMNATGILPVNQEIATNNFSNDPNQSTNHSQPFVAALSSIINSETSFGREQLVQSHLRPFMLHTSSGEIRREDMLPRQQLDVDHSETKSLGQCAVVSIPCDTKEASDVKDNVVESCMPMPESVILSNLGTRTGRSPT